VANACSFGDREAGEWCLEAVQDCLFTAFKNVTISFDSFFIKTVNINTALNAVFILTVLIKNYQIITHTAGMRQLKITISVY
jgi:hypothetical protein